MKFRIDRIDKGISTTNITVSDLDDVISKIYDGNTGIPIRESYQTYSYSFNPIKDDGITVKTAAEAKTEVKDYFTAEATKKAKQNTFSDNIGNNLIGKIL